MSSIHRSQAPEFQKAFDYPFYTENLPDIEVEEGRYVVRFARTHEEIDAALHLRFEVFNLELNEGLESSYLTERDEDDFDQTSHHLLVIEKNTNEVVGTYRLRTYEMAQRRHGFYTEQEFDLKNLPLEVLEQSVEIGRACIDRNFRNTKVLFLLWKGLAMYTLFTKKRYLFGCCSLFSQDCSEGRRAFRMFERDGAMLKEQYRVEPRPACACKEKDFRTSDSGEDLELPRLFKTYLRIGARVCGEPVIDRQFKTIDFFVIFDVKTIEERYYKMFFSQFEDIFPPS
jgi:putative hemolysin